MSATVPPSGVPSLKWTVAAGVAAFALFLLGALVVEPALNRLIEPQSASAGPLAKGQVVIGDPVVSGRYVSTGSDARTPLAVQVAGGGLTVEGAGRLTTTPHRLVGADQKADGARTFAEAMGAPAAAQIEIRRVLADEDSRLCAGQAVGWLALAMRRDGFLLMPVRQGPPPGALAAQDRLCAVRDFGR
ncbi:hypothetical protein SH203_02825 [Brevundimonas sp. SH203]|uniref:hypothetical protein n=1 Tax=Brevundimonas sp. SH203 TaxID=345167 RepID=UPI0009CE8E54|nr:hypothetical protein [Brevundimonas sp. SH203]GAW42409.1 hypothetical protein SH203_02825 [Brevundimonas sp. SH203]